jgi:hypothetical protein
MLPLLALIALILGIILLAVPVKRDPWPEIAKACLWCGLLVCLLSLASWHGIPLR